jgi:hypothetical protein
MRALLKDCIIGSIILVRTKDEKKGPNTNDETYSTTRRGLWASR